MVEKKMPGRFTLQFNMDDPQQSEVARFLDRQGRRKTQFITNAVLHYLKYGRKQAEVNPVDASEVLNILAQIISNSLAPQPHHVEHTEKVAEAAENPVQDSEFSSESSDNTDYSAIASTLLAFDNQ